MCALSSRLVSGIGKSPPLTAHEIGKHEHTHGWFSFVMVPRKVDTIEVKIDSEPNLIISEIVSERRF